MKIQDIDTPVIILKMEHYGSLGIIRSLGSLGIPVHGIDPNPDAPGFRSRYCRGRYIWDVDNAPEERTVDFLMNIGNTMRSRMILIPTSDETSLLVAGHAGRLGEWFIFPTLDPHLVRSLCDKKEMFLLAKKLGIPTARTEFPRSRDDLTAQAMKLGFPIMLKGIDGKKLETRTGKKMVIVRDERELLEQYEMMEDFTEPNLMLQEYIPGNDDTVWMFNGYFNDRSECLLGFTGKKIRQNPVYTGMTSLGICLANTAVEGMTKEFMKAIGYRGILDIGYRHDARDGVYKVLDVNPRIGATFRLFVGTNGMDVARALYLDLTGHHVPDATASEGRKWLVEDKDLRSCIQYFRDGKLTVRAMLKSYFGVKELGYFSLNDPRPFGRMILNHCKRSMRRLAARLTSRPLFTRTPRGDSDRFPAHRGPGRLSDREGSVVRREETTRRTGKRSKSAAHKNGSIRANAVVISFSGHADAYDIVRSLGMAGIPSIVASCRPRDIAFYSRHCAKRVVLPDSERESAIIEQLVQLSIELGVRPVLFYVSDPELSFVWRHQNILRSYYRFLLPGDETLECLFNKVLFHEFAREHQFPVPQTVIVKNISDIASIVSGIGFPCIVKPAYSQDWVWDTEEQQLRFGPYKKALRRFTSADELLRFCEALPQRLSGFLIQSYIDGRDEAITSFHGYFDERSTCLGYFIGRKIRTYPSHTGGSVYVQTIHNPVLARQSIEYLQRIGFQGIVKIDYKLDPAGNEFKMLEINPRYNLWELLGGYAGVNLAAIAYRHQKEEPLSPVELQVPVAPAGTYGDDVRLLFVKQDIRAYLSGYRKTKEWTLRSYVRSLAKKKFFRMFDREDPLPFVVSVIGFTGRNALRLFALMFHRRHGVSSRFRPGAAKKDSTSFSGAEDLPQDELKERIHALHTHIS